MKYNSETRKEKLKSVPIEQRVWIYSAELILEFLNKTFMPTVTFLKDPEMHLQAGPPAAKHDFKDEAIETYKINVLDLYDMYRLYREAQGYTAPIETLFRFKVILKKMRLYKNGWQFIKLRKGVDQSVFYSPLQLRSRVTPEERAAAPVPATDVSKGQVEVGLEDMQTKPRRQIKPETEINWIDAEPPPGQSDGIPATPPPPIITE